MKYAKTGGYNNPKQINKNYINAIYNYSSWIMRLPNYFLNTLKVSNYALCPRVYLWTFSMLQTLKNEI